MDSQFLRSCHRDVNSRSVEAQGRTYGYEVACRRVGGAVRTASSELKEGSLYPALHRLERQRLVAVDLGRSRRTPSRRHYELTDAGRAELAARKRSWLSFTAGVNGVLGTNRVGLADAREPPVPSLRAD